MEEIKGALKAREVNGSPGGDRTPRSKRRVEDAAGPSGAAVEQGGQAPYRKPDWESRVYDGWVSGGRSVVRYTGSQGPEAPVDSAAPAPPVRYAELHCHTNYSFKEGASEAWDLLVTAKQLGYEALAVTDHDNLCAAMDFAQYASSIGIKAVIGVEVTLATPPSDGQGGRHLTLLAETAQGYSNICRLLTRAHMDAAERDRPALDPALLPSHAAGVICLSGCRRGETSELLSAGDYPAALSAARRYAEWFGPGNFFLEMQQNLVKGDTQRNRLLARIGAELGIPLVATNNVHYHVRERHRLNDALVAVQHNRSLEETHRERRPNDQFYLKPPAEVASLFTEWPEAIANTVAIADRCQFDLAKDIRKIYSFPRYDVPEGHTPLTWLRRLCDEAAERKYSRSDAATWSRLQARLDEEFRLIGRYDLAGFLLQYRDIINIAHEVQQELRVVPPGTRMEDQPPGRGRGSSVALVAGYLIGLSHIDPIRFNLGLDRFLPDVKDGEQAPALDIDLDFPREIREELILRVHQRKGPEFAALTGMISTYKVRGAIRDLGKALGLPEEDLAKLIKLMDGHAGIKQLAGEMAALSEYRDRLDAPLWKDLVDLALQLNHFPKYLAQHPGGMVLSARPLSEAVPLQRSAIDGRVICQWEKNSAEDAGFVKIDFLALGTLSQMTEALRLIREQREEVVNLSRIDFEDRAVYADIHAADTIGVFQIESAAQMQTVVRLKPSNLEEMAWEVGAVRPGVGVNDGVTLLIRRYNRRRQGLPPDWEYDHPLEEKALGRTLGVPLFQDQLGELARHVAGMTTMEGDKMRRAFSHRNSARLIPFWHEKFIAGARANGVSEEAAERIYGKFHGLYQFPEAHAYAFGVTAYQMAWLKHYYPLEFFVGLYNNQPMGFYNLETLKEDAKRHGITVLSPDVNLSDEMAVIEDGRLRMGLRHVAKVQEATSRRIVMARAQGGPFMSLAQFIERTGVPGEAVDNLAWAGALDRFDPHHARTSVAPPQPREEARRRPEQVEGATGGLRYLPEDVNGAASHPESAPAGSHGADRRSLRWEAGLRYRPVGMQLSLGAPVDQDMVALPPETGWQRMMNEYSVMGVHPGGHIMAYLRPALPSHVARSDSLHHLGEGARVTVAGLVIRRQRPSGKATFITLEDEFGHSPLVIWPQVYRRVRLKTVSQLLVATGTVSKREGTMNIVVEQIEPVNVEAPVLHTKDWG
jgi:error-prone DNA polymerase